MTPRSLCRVGHKAGNMDLLLAVPIVVLALSWGVLYLLLKRKRKAQSRPQG